MVTPHVVDTWVNVPIYNGTLLMSGAKKTTRYPPATAANGATAEAIAKALLAPLKPLQKK